MKVIIELDSTEVNDSTLAKVKELAALCGDGKSDEVSAATAPKKGKKGGKKSDPVPEIPVVDAQPQMHSAPTGQGFSLPATGQGFGQNTGAGFGGAQNPPANQAINQASQSPYVDKCSQLVGIMSTLNGATEELVANEVTNAVTASGGVAGRRVSEQSPQVIELVFRHLYTRLQALGADLSQVAV